MNPGLSRLSGAVSLLVSVSDVEEAELALAAGVDLIDLKDPRAGALGALSVGELRDILAAIAGRCATSATTGDMAPDAEVVCAAAARIAATGVDYVKVGLWPGPRRRDVIAQLGKGPGRQARLVGVLLADGDPDFALVPAMAHAGFAGAMLDIARKGSTLTQLMSADRLASFVALCRTEGLACGLAGSLRIADISPLVSLKPDILGFRGSLCHGRDRTRALDPQSLDEAVAAMQTVRRERAARAS